MEWQPIETAPKTGRTILLGYVNSHGNWRTLRGQWFSDEAILDWEDPEDFEAGWYERRAKPPPCFWAVGLSVGLCFSLFNEGESHETNKRTNRKIH